MMPVLFNDLAKETFLNMAALGCNKESKSVADFTERLELFEEEFDKLPDLNLSKNIYPYNYYMSSVSDIKIAILKLEDVNDDVRNKIICKDCFLYLRLDTRTKRLDAFLTKSIGLANDVKKIDLSSNDILSYIDVLERNKVILETLRQLNLN